MFNFLREAFFFFFSSIIASIISLCTEFYLSCFQTAVTNHCVNSREKVITLWFLQKLRIQEIMLSHLQRLWDFMDTSLLFLFQDNTSTLMPVWTAEIKVQDRNINQTVSICHSHQDLLAQLEQWVPTAVSRLEHSKWVLSLQVSHGSGILHSFLSWYSYAWVIYVTVVNLEGTPQCI